MQALKVGHSLWRKRQRVLFHLDALEIFEGQQRIEFRANQLQQLFHRDAICLNALRCKPDNVTVSGDRTLNRDVQGNYFLNCPCERGTIGIVVNPEVFNLAIGGLQLLSEHSGQAFAGDKDLRLGDNSCSCVALGNGFALRDEFRSKVHELITNSGARLEPTTRNGDGALRRAPHDLRVYRCRTKH